MNKDMTTGLLKSILIVGFIFIVLYFISYNKWLYKSNNFDDIDITYGKSKSNENKTEDKQNIEEIVDNKELYSKINYEFLQYNLGTDFYNMYYNNNKFTDEYFMFIGIINIIGNEMLVNCNISKELDGILVDKKINELLGNVKYNKHSFKNSDDSMIVTYDESINKFNIKTNRCSGTDFTNGGIKNIYVKSLKDENNLYIFEKSLYLDYTFDNYSNIIFNYHEGINKSSKVIAHNLEDINLDSIESYKYTFKLDNGVYTLISISK